METVSEKRPVGVLFWIVGVVALLWNGMGVINLVQQMSPAGLATLPPEYQAFIETRPVWAFVGFAVSVIAGVIGAVLMFMRSRMAVSAFILSGIGALLATIPALGGGIMSVIIGSALSIVLAVVFAAFAARKLA